LGSFKRIFAETQFRDLARMKTYDANNNDAILTTYIHANGEVLAQHNGSYAADRYYYLHDRLGSVRMLIDSDGAVANHYTYDPWGLVPTGESYEDVNNLYRFANYAYDSETNLYYCINRIYDPVLWRFTSKDPVQGTYENPMTLHRYLYVTNNPINDKDPTGKMGLWGALRAAERTVEAVDAYYGALDFGLTNTGNPAGMLDWLPELNAQRELLFSERRINRPYNWEAYLGPNMEGFLWKVIGTASNGLLQGMENIYNLCDWPKLSGCILTEISQHQQEFSICAGFFYSCLYNPIPHLKAASCLGTLGCGIAFSGKCINDNCPNRRNPVNY
jgi:RHS repeat-associated protein